MTRALTKRATPVMTRIAVPRKEKSRNLRSSQKVRAIRVVTTAPTPNGLVISACPFIVSRSPHPNPLPQLPRRYLSRRSDRGSRSTRRPRWDSHQLCAGGPRPIQRLRLMGLYSYVLPKGSRRERRRNASPSFCSYLGIAPPPPALFTLRRNVMAALAATSRQGTGRTNEDEHGADRAAES